MHALSSNLFQELIHIFEFLIVFLKLFFSIFVISTEFHHAFPALWKFIVSICEEPEKLMQCFLIWLSSITLPVQLNKFSCFCYLCRFTFFMIRL